MEADIVQSAASGIGFEHIPRSHGQQGNCDHHHSHSTAPTILPIGPPNPLTAVTTRLPAFDTPAIAGPPEDLTFVSPSEAFDCMLLAVSFVLAAACEAPSLAFSVVEAHRKRVLRARMLRLV